MATPVIVYGAPMSTAVSRVLACLYEKNVEFELISINMSKGEHKKPEFLKLQCSDFKGFCVSGRNSLIEIEGAECALKDEVIDESFAIVAKFYTKRKVNLKAVARTFRSVWKADGDFEFRDLGNNRALMVFSDEVDMNRV
ncbi:hypothetical protein SO802_022449 [Lithocarpus litseifolius]|uniref:glutathione transferase n=1 Tax=Lithocarpus litseifolius TaxID=425828 RepID=A0AAW2CI59_9ROSI